MKMLKQMIVSGLVVSMMGIVCAATTTPKVYVDVYKSEQITRQQITKKFAGELQEMLRIYQLPEGLAAPGNVKQYTSLLEKIATETNKLGKFSYLNISPVLYPSDKNIYLTIDVVDASDTARMPNFLPKPTKTFSDPDNLIKTWQEYEKIGFNKFYKTNTAPEIKSCPAFHCEFGFDDPALRKYKDIFVNRVPKNKDKLVKILREDRDDNKRATAAFLLAHIKDGNELLKILIPSMRDSNSGVRNNTMRVLGETLMKLKTADFPIEEAAKALDYPATVDRNKALLILVALSNQPRYANYIKANLQDALLTELKMRQPDLHSLSYQVLKSISGKSYAEHNYRAWKKWLST